MKEVFADTAYWSVQIKFTCWVPLLACPAVREARLDKPTVAPVKSNWTDHYYLALLNAHDELHERATTVTAGITDRLLTTTWVLTEVVDALSRPAFRSTVVKFIDALRADPQVTIVPASQDLFDRGFDLFARRPDKEWSLTDCISCVVMQEHSLTDALTSDHHFRQMGFRTLLG